MSNICSSPNYASGDWKIQLSVCLKGTNLMPRSGLEPTVRIDICEDVVFTNFVIKAIYELRNNNWIQLLFRIP